MPFHALPPILAFRLESKTWLTMKQSKHPSKEPERNHIRFGISRAESNYHPRHMTSNSNIAMQLIKAKIEAFIDKVRSLDRGSSNRHSEFAASCKVLLQDSMHDIFCLSSCWNQSEDDLKSSVLIKGPSPRNATLTFAGRNSNPLCFAVVQSCWLSLLVVGVMEVRSTVMKKN